MPSMAAATRLLTRSMNVNNTNFRKEGAPVANRKDQANKKRGGSLRTWLRENPGIQIALIGLAGTLITAAATVIAAFIRG